MSRAEWAGLVAGWFPGLVDARVRSLTFGTVDAHRGVIRSMLESNTVSTVWQRLHDEAGLADTQGFDELPPVRGRSSRGRRMSRR